MPRKSLIRSDFLPYHVTARANNREEFHASPEQTWKTLSDNAYLISMLFGAEVHALVLMPNHFHMLITVPNEDLGVVMDRFLSSITRTLNLISGRTGRVFGGPYHWTLIHSGRYFATALKYVYRNPVKAGLSKSVEDYPWSTLFGTLGNDHLPFPIHLPRSGHGLFLASTDLDRILKWLNQPFPKELDESIRWAFKKRELTQLKLRTSRRAVPEEELMP